MPRYYLAYKAADGRWKCRLFNELHNAYAWSAQFERMAIVWDWGNLRSNYFYN